MELMEEREASVNDAIFGKSEVLGLWVARANDIRQVRS